MKFNKINNKKLILARKLYNTKEYNNVIYNTLSFHTIGESYHKF